MNRVEVEELLVCARTHNICIAADSVEGLNISQGLWTAQDVKDLQAQLAKPGSDAVARMGLFQFAGGTTSSCIIAVYSGGSAASWLVNGWHVSDRQISRIQALEKYSLNGDGMNTVDLSLEISKAYRRNQPR